MPPVSQVDDPIIETMEITGWDRDRVMRVAAAPPEIRQLELQNERDQDWSNPGTSAGQRLLELLAIIGTVAGVVTGVAGASSAVEKLVG